MTDEREDETQVLGMEDLVGDYGGDRDLDPQEQQRDRNAHLLLSAWKMIMAAEAEEERLKH